jgi:hypothetical protein
MRITIHGHRPACLRPAAESTPEPQPANVLDRPTGASANANQGAVRNIYLGFFKLKIHQQNSRQTGLLAQLSPSFNAQNTAGDGLHTLENALPASQGAPGAHALSNRGSASPADQHHTQDVSSAPENPDVSPLVAQAGNDSLGEVDASGELHKANLPKSALSSTQAAAPLTIVSDLGRVNAEWFANDFIAQRLINLPPGANVLILADGKESKSAGTLALDYSHLNLYSTDYDYPESVAEVEMFGIGYKKVKVDNTQRLNPDTFGDPNTQFDAVLMLKGLCDHNEWQDKDGNDAGPVGCGGIQLSPEGISSKLAEIALTLAENARFALHGEINFRDREAEHPALSPEVQKNILAGVERFNAAYGEGMACVATGDSGLVVTGENPAVLTCEQQTRIKALVDEYFSQDRSLAYKKD